MEGRPLAAHHRLAALADRDLLEHQEDGVDVGGTNAARDGRVRVRDEGLLHETLQHQEVGDLHARHRRW